MSVFLVTGFGLRRISWWRCTRVVLADLVEADSADDAVNRSYNNPDVVGLESVSIKVCGEVFREDLLELALGAQSKEASDGTVEAG